MEVTAIIAGLLAAAGALAVLAAFGLRAEGGNRQNLIATRRLLGDRLHLQRLPGTRWALSWWVRSRKPAWRFAVTASLGLILIAAAAIGTARLAAAVAAGDGNALLDHPVAHFVPAHRSGALTTAMRAVSTAGDPLIVAAVTLVTGMLLGVLRRSLGPVVLATASVAGAAVLIITLKEALGRSRPQLDAALAAADGHAFPSAHAVCAAALFGVLAYLLAAQLHSWPARVAVWAAAAMLTALVGISRIYLGVHWTTDVIGGWACGLLWLTVVVTSWASSTHRRHDRPEKTGPAARLRR